MVSGSLRDAGEGGDAVHGAFEVADAGADAQREVVLHLVRQLDALARPPSPRRSARGLRSTACSIVRDEAPAELVSGSASPRRSWRVEVAGDDDAAALVVQAGERLVELVERRLLAQQQVDVVDEQQVDVAVAGAEGGAGLVAQRPS